MKPAYVEQFIKTSMLTGNWGMSRTKKGVSRVFDRLTFTKSAAELRKIIIPSIEEATKKITNMRQVHTTQIGYVCPVDTPEGEKVGIVKSLTVMAAVTSVDAVSAPIISKVVDSFEGFVSLAAYEYKLHERFVNVVLNGVWVGVIAPDRASGLLLRLRDMKLRQQIGRNTALVMNCEANEIDICTDAGRLVRPLLRVADGNELVYSGARVKQHTFDEFMVANPGCVEMVDVMESMFQHVVAEDIGKLHRARRMWLERAPGVAAPSFTSAEFHPSLGILGLCASTIPFLNHNQAPRNTYHCSQVKHAMGFHSTVHKKRYDNTNILYDPQRPLARPRYMDSMGFRDLPYGKNVILAIMPFTGYNQEDSMILNKTSTDRGLFASSIVRRFESCIDKNHGSSANDEVFGKPDKALIHNQNEYNYAHLNNDVIIGKMQQVVQPSATGDDKKILDKSVVYRSDNPSRVDCVLRNINGDGYGMMRVKTRSVRTPLVGDKFTSRAGQKSTCGLLMRAEDMPFTSQGLVPDIVINSNCIPSRMTIGQLYEMLFCKAGALSGEFVDATAFEARDMAAVEAQLAELGYDAHGTETMWSGITGEQLTSRVFIGPCYYTRLKHMVVDKIHARSIGSNQILTRQPPEGRAKNGGVRFGEMERDATLAHGVAVFLKERFVECSDHYVVSVCDLCGHFGSKLKQGSGYWCKHCNNYLRISKVQIPYCFKLMIQELESVHISMRLRTDNSVL